MRTWRINTSSPAAKSKTGNACHTFEYPDFIITLSLFECEMLSAFTLKEHESYAWISPKDLNAKEWAPADADVLGGLKRIFGE